MVSVAVERIKKLSNSIQVVAGNVATAEEARALIGAGADGVKIGIGPGSICTTRVVGGVGVPPLTAIMESTEAAEKSRIPVVFDVGPRPSGEPHQALGGGARSVMEGRPHA